MKLPVPYVFTFALLIGLSANGQETKVFPPAVQIAMASQVAPEADRDGVAVYGYDANGTLVLLREGTNNLVCLADDPAKEGIQISCYNKKLEPFMARGRALKAEGKSVLEIRETREQEVAAGTLQMPDAPSMLYILSGEEAQLNKETGMLTDGYLRYVIYIPFATTESTGLPDKPHAPGMPWLMDPGTHRAHIMVSPPPKEKPN
jgi:hypothetical protein